MIRPFTCLCLLLAGGSGLYLYQEKHRTQLLDREIGRVMRETQETRGRIGALRAEWAVRTEPGRLADLATRFLALKPMAPTQFVQLADLSSHLPAVGPMPAAAPVPAEDEAASLPLAARPADQAGATASAEADADDEASPPTPQPAVAKTMPDASKAASDVAASDVAAAQDVGDDDAPAPAALHVKQAAKPAPAAHARRPADAQLAHAIDPGRPTTAQAHGGLLPLALSRPTGMRLLQAAARPGSGTRATALPRTLQPQGGAFIGSSLGGAASLPPAVPYTGE